MKQAKINLYQFEELNEEAKERVILEHEDFLLSVGVLCENESGEIVTEYPETIERETVIESITINEYYFFHDGVLASICEYSDNHPTKAGKTEFKFHGQIIEI